MKPLLAHKYAEATKRLTWPCIMQPKLNGVRALWQAGRGFFSRDEIPWHPAKLAHIDIHLRTLFSSEDLILDGELYVHGWSLQRINSAVAVNSKYPTDETPAIQYHVFDVADPSLPFLHRYKPVLTTLKSAANPSICHVPTYTANSPSVGDEIYARVCALGYEGAMYRLGDCPYTRPKQVGADGKFLSDQDNRAWHLLKRKDWQDAEFRVVGVVEGRTTDKGGKYRESLGAFTLLASNGETFNAAPAFTDGERKFFYDNPPIGKLATVRYLVLSDDGIPLNPRVLTIRES